MTRLAADPASAESVHGTQEDDAPLAVLVAVGDELLLGETVDSNTAWLARALGRLGIEVTSKYTVGDDDDRIREALERALGEGDLVVFTGGLGPTADDRTRGAVASGLGLELRLDEDVLRGIEERFRARGFSELPPTNVRQAQVPDGARALPNPVGTAPGLLIPTARALVALLPGVPREMEAITGGTLLPALREAFGRRLRPVHSRTIRTTGISESVLAERIEACLPDDPGPASVAFLPDRTGVDVRITVRGLPEAEEASRTLDRVEGLLAPAVATYRYQAPGNGDLVEAVHELLRARGSYLAVAESCTGGLLAKRLTDVPGASESFMGGVVSYANDVKSQLLGVDPGVIEREGAVSRVVAEEMALGAARVLGAECAIGITGVAGPGGGTDDKPVGLVWYAVSVQGDVESREERFAGDREGIRERAAQAALALLYRRLQEK